MKHILYYFLGSTVFVMPSNYATFIFNISNSLHIKIINFDVKKDELIFRIYIKDEEKLINELNRINIEFKIIKRKGLKSNIKRYKHRIGIVSGILLFFFALYISPKFIWEINIEGNEKLSYNHVCDMLQKEGVYIGAYSPAVDRRTLYMNVLKNSEDISWISVNFSGSSANVEIVERDISKVSEITADGANIIAEKDGQIIDTEVICGKVVVNKNEVVKKGDILVSGVYDTGKFGTRYVYSEAEVLAVVYDSFNTEIPLNYEKCVTEEESLIELKFKIFNKTLNIFKNYSNSYNNYDIINRNVNLPIPLLSTLPISIEEVYTCQHSYTPVLLTEVEALKIARQDLFNTIDNSADYIEILAYDEEYYVNNNVFIYKCNIEAVENIAEIAEFNAQ